MLLCLNCHCATDVAYNELCYGCYRKIGRTRGAKRERVSEVSSQAAEIVAA